MKIKPIEIKIIGKSSKAPHEICEEFLDTKRWSEFEGYSILPGIKSAHFEKRTPELKGSRIRVQNTDGSSHIEEIIEWDINHKIKLLFQSFDSPLKYAATHFIETWEFRQLPNETEISRTMEMYPSGITGWLILIPISRLMKKAFEKNLNQNRG